MMSQVNALLCNNNANGHSCFSTTKYKIPGSNSIEMCQWVKYVGPIENLINLATQSWYDSHKSLNNLEEIETVGISCDANNNFGAWMQMVQSNADRIGCSMIEYTKQNEYYCKRLVCNNNAAVLQGLPVFTFGAPASDCKMGKNPEYPGLCNPSEDFSQHKHGNHFFTKDASESPVLKVWLENGKKLNLRNN